MLLKRIRRNAAFVVAISAAWLHGSAMIAWGQVDWDFDGTGPTSTADLSGVFDLVENPPVAVGFASPGATENDKLTARGWKIIRQVAGLDVQTPSPPYPLPSGDGTNALHVTTTDLAADPPYLYTALMLRPEVFIGTNAEIAADVTWDQSFEGLELDGDGNPILDLGGNPIPARTRDLGAGDVISLYLRFTDEDGDLSTLNDQSYYVAYIGQLVAFLASGSVDDTFIVHLVKVVNGEAQVDDALNTLLGGDPRFDPIQGSGNGVDPGFIDQILPGDTARVAFRVEDIAGSTQLTITLTNPFDETAVLTAVDTVDPLTRAGRAGVGAGANPSYFDNLAVTSLDPAGIAPDPVVAAEVDPTVSALLRIASDCVPAVTYDLTIGDTNVVSDPGELTFEADGPVAKFIDLSIGSAGTTTLSASPTGAPAAGCGNLPPVDVAVVELTELNLALAATPLTIGERRAVNVTGTFDNGTHNAGTRNMTDQVAYSVDPSGVVEVSPDGIVTGLTGGMVTLVARFTNGLGEAIEGTATLTVSPERQFIELAGRVRFEAESFSSRTARAVENQQNWVVVPDENADPDPAYQNADGACNDDSSGRYLVALPDAGDNESAGDPFNTSALVGYRFVISNGGDYRIWVRAAAVDGSSDSAYLRIRELHAATNEWWRFNPSDTGGDFTDAWTGSGGFGTGTGGTAGDDPIIETLTPGLYTLEIAMREDGAGLDALLLDSTGTFDGTDSAAALVPCSPACPQPEDVTVASHVPLDGPTINLASLDLPTVVGIPVAIPGPSDGTVTARSSNTLVVDNGQPGSVAGSATFSAANGATCASMVVNVASVGSTMLTLDNDMGFDNGTSARLLIVFGPDSPLAIQLQTAGMEPGDSQQLAVVGSFGAAGSRTIPASDVVFTSSDPTLLTIDADGRARVPTDATVTGGVDVTITATFDGVAGTAAVVVSPQLIELAFIVGDPENLNTGDEAVVTHLSSLEFGGDPPVIVASGGLPARVVLFNDDAFDALDIEREFDLVLVSSTVTAANIGGRFRDLSIPMVFWESLLNQVGFEGLTDGGAATDAFADIFPFDFSHPITQGLDALVDSDGFLVVYNSPQTITYSGFSSVARAGTTLATGALALADYEFENEATIIVAGPGDDPDIPGGDGLRVDGASEFRGRRVFLWLGDDTADKLNATGLEIVDRSLSWALASRQFIAAPVTQGAINCGGDESVSAELDVPGLAPVTFTFAPDQAFNVVDGFGYEGGAALDQRGCVTLLDTDSAREPLLNTARTGETTYRFRVVPGRYHVQLHFAEISPLGVRDNQSNRVLNVFVEDRLVLENFRPAKAAALDAGVSAPVLAKQPVTRAYELDVDPDGPGEALLEVAFVDLGDGIPPFDPIVNAINFIRLGDATAEDIRPDPESDEPPEIGEGPVACPTCDLPPNTVAYTCFEEPPTATQNYVSIGGELGFTTFVTTAALGQGPLVGVVHCDDVLTDSPLGGDNDGENNLTGHFFLVDGDGEPGGIARTTGFITLDPVDLTGVGEATLVVRATPLEPGDNANGFETQDQFVVDARFTTGAATQTVNVFSFIGDSLDLVGGPPDFDFIVETYTLAIPADVDSVQVVLTGSRSGNTEQVYFDAVFIVEGAFAPSAPPLHPNAREGLTGAGRDPGFRVVSLTVDPAENTGIDLATARLGFCDAFATDAIADVINADESGALQPFPGSQTVRTFPGYGGTVDDINMRATTLIEFPEPGTYTFFYNTDDGHAALIGASGFARFDGTRPPTADRFEVNVLVPGIYPLALDFLHAGAEDGAFLFYQEVDGGQLAYVGDVAGGAVAVWQTADPLPPNFPHDLDSDGAVGQSDFDALEACFSAADMPVSGDCLSADFDLDFDVDCDDLGALQAVATSGMPPDIAECAGGGPAPELVNIMGGASGATDTWISPLGDNVPFDTVEVTLSTESTLAAGPGMTLTSNGGGSHTLTLGSAVPVGTCVTVSFDVADAATGAVGTITLTLCHLPLDVNQDGVVNIADITAWANEFNGDRRAALVDTNGDGAANVGDATQVGNMWFGRPPATKAWNGEALP